MNLREFCKLLASVSVGLGLASQVLAQKPVEPPRYGGTINVSSFYPTISSLGWDPADWNWKLNVDNGYFQEQLLTADLNKGLRGGGTEKFANDSYIPKSAMRGELAESWQVLDNPPRAVFKLRKGIMWPAKDGVMASREFIADDVVYAHNRLMKSPKADSSYMDFIKGIEATDKYTVTYLLSRYHAEWDFRIGWGYYTSIMPKEVVEAPNGGATNWKNMVGTGPFKLTDFTSGSSATYSKNEQYWDKDKIGGKEYSLPFVDKVVLSTVRDAQTRLASFRTGNIDVLLNAGWRDLAALGPIIDKVRIERRPAIQGLFLAMRNDQKPFDDIRVRKAMNMAVDKQSIVKNYYRGNAELLNLPFSREFSEVFVPLDKQPAAIRELYEYNPEKAKKLLAEAGYPNGFEFKAQVSANVNEHVELAQLVAGFLAKVNVKMTVAPVEYAAFQSLMKTRNHGPGYLMTIGLTSPTASIDKQFISDRAWNTSMMSDPQVDKEFAAVMLERDNAKQVAKMKEVTTRIFANVPYVFLPVPDFFTVWWPWVKNYNGEIHAGGMRPAPIIARAWIDQDLKKKMGY